jgi:diguanylate cyclase (GGDEF)-like protein
VPRSASAAIDGEGRQLGFLSVVSDISERKEQERKLHQLATTTDPLTGLWKRRYFLEPAEQLLRYARWHEQKVAIAIVDVDHFKRINNSHGHDAGDAMLRTVAQVLKHVMRETDLYCRWGGEEFLLALPHTTGEDALGVLERLRSAMSAVVLEHGDALIRARLSAGASDWRAAEFTLDQAVRRVDRALYRAKGDGRNCVRAEWSQDGAAEVA